MHKLLVETYAIPSQVFLLRWVRLLYCREFSLEATLELWTEVFLDGCINRAPFASTADNCISFPLAEAEEDSFLNLGEYIAVAMIRYVKSSLEAADESGAAMILMKYPQVDVNLLVGRGQGHIKVAC